MTGRIIKLWCALYFLITLAGCKHQSSELRAIVDGKGNSLGFLPFTMQEGGHIRFGLIECTDRAGVQHIYDLEIGRATLSLSGDGTLVMYNSANEPLADHPCKLESEVLSYVDLNNIFPFVANIDFITSVLSQGETTLTDMLALRQAVYLAMRGNNQFQTDSTFLKAMREAKADHESLDINHIVDFIQPDSEADKELNPCNPEAAYDRWYTCNEDGNFGLNNKKYQETKDLLKRRISEYVMYVKAHERASPERAIAQSPTPLDESLPEVDLSMNTPHVTALGPTMNLDSTAVIPKSKRALPIPQVKVKQLMDAFREITGVEKVDFVPKESAYPYPSSAGALEPVRFQRLQNAPNGRSVDILGALADLNQTAQSLVNTHSPAAKMRFESKPIPDNHGGNWYKESDKLVYVSASNQHTEWTNPSPYVVRFNNASFLAYCNKQINSWGMQRFSCKDNDNRKLQVWGSRETSHKNQDHPLVIATRINECRNTSTSDKTKICEPLGVNKILPRDYD